MFNLFKMFKKENKREINDIIYWQNAVYAVLTYINSENHNIVGGIKKVKKRQ